METYVTYGYGNRKKPNVIDYSVPSRPARELAYRESPTQPTPHASSSGVTPLASSHRRRVPPHHRRRAPPCSLRYVLPSPSLPPERLDRLWGPPAQRSTANEP